VMTLSIADLETNSGYRIFGETRSSLGCLGISDVFVDSTQPVVRACAPTSGNGYPDPGHLSRYGVES